MSSSVGKVRRIYETNINLEKLYETNINDGPPITAVPLNEGEILQKGQMYVPSHGMFSIRKPTSLSNLLNDDWNYWMRGGQLAMIQPGQIFMVAEILLEKEDPFKNKMVWFSVIFKEDIGFVCSPRDFHNFFHKIIA